MTTLAIIGSGILGRSLIYALAKEQKPIEKITLFYSDNFTPACTFSSTAIVAPRGLSTGLSPLGDTLIEGFQTFSEHVELDRPAGVEKIIQYTAATDKLDEFAKRYPLAKKAKTFLKQEALMQTDVAYAIDPRSYTDWLLSEALAMKGDQIEIVEDLVTGVQENEHIHVKTLNGKNLSFDKVIFAGGTYNRFWQNLEPDSKKLKSSKPVQGSYYEWNEIEWNIPSFSLTLDGDNLVWDNNRKRLLLGSTTLETNHFMAPHSKLKEIYLRLDNLCDLKLPPVERAEVKAGLREKAQKREPYEVVAGNKFFLGGLYKNGFSLALKIARNFSHQHL